jgi:cysteine desulfurase family protein
MIYLDNAATSFPKPETVPRAVLAALAAPASPGRSGHVPSLEASRVIHRARKAVAGLLGISDNTRLVFTPNVTWALNAAISGLDLQPGDHVLSGPLEHNSVARPLARLKLERGVLWEVVPLTGDNLDPAEFKRRVGPRTRLVVLNHASNVGGALAPALEIKEAVGSVPMILDTAQTAGSVPLEEYGGLIDVLTFTGHKGLLGPTGTGGLWIRPGLDLRPLAVGGSGSRSESLEHPDFLPDALEAGTANTHGLAGLAAGVEWVAARGVAAIRKRELALARDFLDRIKSIPGLAIVGPPPGDERRVATISVTLSGWSSSDLSAALESRAGIMTRSGLHCAPLAHKSLGTFPGGSTRFSIGPENSEADVETAARVLGELAGAGGS